MKKLVAYFSASGVTKSIATELAEAIKADVFEIVPSIPYSDVDLNWMDKNSRSSEEMVDVNSRPAIKTQIDSFEKYDTIFIGFPIWWYIEPRIIDTFLESYDFKGKTLIPFATSGGSGIEKANSRLKSMYPDVNWIDGKLLNKVGSASKWVKTDLVL